MSVEEVRTAYSSKVKRNAHGRRRLSISPEKPVSCSRKAESEPTREPITRVE
jgi:hypothetical protein